MRQWQTYLSHMAALFTSKTEGDYCYFVKLEYTLTWERDAELDLLHLTPPHPLFFVKVLTNF